MSELRKCFSVHTVNEYLQLAEQLDRAAERCPADAEEYRRRAEVFRRLASKRKPDDVPEANFYK